VFDLIKKCCERVMEKILMGFDGDDDGRGGVGGVGKLMRKFLEVIWVDDCVNFDLFSIIYFFFIIFNF
jgi:hypothetical protein